MTENSSDRRVQIITNLLPLLNEISAAFETMSEIQIDQTLDSRIINYINRHISDNLSLDVICERYYISKSHLCHIFKKATAMTVCEYITAKRLVAAKQLILSGISPQGYIRVRLRDYSVFYRAFKRNTEYRPDKYKFLIYAYAKISAQIKEAVKKRPKKPRFTLNSAKRRTSLSKKSNIKFLNNTFL